MQKNPLKIVANLPYYVTTPIIMGFLESELPIEQMTFMIQKEVGERLCAEPGTKAYGSLTIAAQFYAETEISFYVPAAVFMPRPKVDSIVVTLKKGQSRQSGCLIKSFFPDRKGFVFKPQKNIDQRSANEHRLFERAPAECSGKMWNSSGCTG